MFIDEKKLGEAFRENCFAKIKTKAPWQLALADAADVIEHRGHSKGQLQDKATGAVCFRGAYSYVNHASEENTPLMIQAEFAMAKYLGLEYSSDTPIWPTVIVTWNNAPERTAAEVIATMRAVAAL